MILDFVDAIVTAIDPANKELTDRRNTKTTKLALFTVSKNASWAADSRLNKEAYPFAGISFEVNRDGFRYEVGDAFRFNYSSYGIVDMVCRIARITEESPTSEVITIEAYEDPEYVASYTGKTSVTGKATLPLFTFTVLSHVSIMEAPYVALVDKDRFGVIPVAAREVMSETGYVFYLSIDDGDSYFNVENIPTYNPYGVLAVEAYPEDTYKIDDQEGFYVDFSNDDVDIIDTVTRNLLCAGRNLAMLGDELITFQTITPTVIPGRYKIEGVYRGRFDTEREEHAVGEAFYFAGSTNYRIVSHSEVLPGATRHFKFVPFSLRGAGDLSEATALSLEISGRARKPYIPENFRADDYAYKPYYTGDIVLTWSPRVRGEGAGFNLAESVVPAAVSWEGYFEIEVWVSDVLVRTTSAIDAATWTYTQAMNTSDNGALADTIVFKLKNYRESEGITYSSDQRELTVRKA